MRTNDRLPRTADLNANPWADEGQSTNALANQAGIASLNSNFSPAAASTPISSRTSAAASVPRLTQQQLRQQLSRAPDSPSRPRPRAPAYSNSTLPFADAATHGIASASAAASIPRLAQQQLRQQISRAPDSPSRPRPRAPAYSNSIPPLTDAVTHGISNASVAASIPRLTQQRLRQHLSRAPDSPLSSRPRAPAYSSPTFLTESATTLDDPDAPAAAAAPRLTQQQLRQALSRAPDSPARPRLRVPAYSNLEPLPVAATMPNAPRTPTAASDAHSTQQRLRQHLSRVPDAPAPARRRVPAYESAHFPAPTSSEVVDQRDGVEDTETLANARNAMEVDEPECESNSAIPNPGKSKGKGRATSVEREDSDPENCEERQPSPDWDEDELARARQESLHQSLSDRSGGWQSRPRHVEMQTDGAGPSRERGRDIVRGESTRGEREPRTRPQTRDDTGLLTREYTHRTRRDGPSTGGRTAGGRENWAASEGLERAQGRRAPSDFYPLPNTRAADYLADRGELEQADDGTPSWMPPSRQQHRYEHEDSRDGGRAGHDAPGFNAAPPWMVEDAEEGRRTEGATSFNDRDQHASDDEWEQEDDLEWGYGEDGEILPSALQQDAPRDNATPTPIPEGSFPVVHHDDPETALRGMAIDWLREIWSDAPNEDVLVHPYNYHYSEDDALNRRVADALRWAFEQITGEVDFDVVPPELEDGTHRRLRNLPSIWAVRGLTPRGSMAAIARGAWSFDTISFLTAPRTTPMQSWLFTLEGYLRGDPQKIQAAVMRVLMEDSMRAWIIDMISSNPSFAGWPLGRAFEEVIGSLRVDVIQLGNGNYVANVHIRSPTRDILEWRRWVADLRSRRYRSFAIGTGRVRQVIQCSGCRSVAHPAHLCPFPRIRGWNGPAPGEGVFRERGSRSDNRCTTTVLSAERGETRRGARPDPRGGWSRQDAPRRRRNDRSDYADRSDRDRHNGRDGRGDRGSRGDRSGRDGCGGYDPSNRGANGRGSGRGNGRGGRRNY